MFTAFFFPKGALRSIFHFANFSLLFTLIPLFTWLKLLQYRQYNDENKFRCACVFHITVLLCSRITRVYERTDGISLSTTVNTGLKMYQNN